MDVFDLTARLRLDSSDYEDGLKNAENRAGSYGSKLKSGLATAAKVGVAAIGATATAIGTLAKKSVSSFAEQEQLIGGVKKLYGNMGMSVEEYAKSVGKSVSSVKGTWGKLEKAQNTVLSNARKAYKTSGMSANQYMETATSFSAALINSLNGNTQKAAEQTDVAMRAISDNFNTFGGDIGNIQYAFQGFAKQNYTMLDNLKLGYGGTKTEMERLIKDANEYAKANGQAADLSIDSFSDIVTAIDLIQQKQGIAGTTAREATETISGSFGMLKASWEDLLAGFGDKDANLDALIDNVMSSAGTVAKNALPVIENALKSMGNAIIKAGPVLVEKIPEAIDSVLPTLLEAGTQLLMAIVTGLVQSAPTLVDGFFKVVDILFDAVKQIDWSEIGKQIMDQLKRIFSEHPKAMTAVMVGFGLKLGLPLVKGLSQALSGTNGISGVLGKVFGGGGATGGAAGSVGGGFLGDPKQTAKGLASVGIIIGGVTAIVEAFGALNKIPGIQEFTQGGGELLKKVFDAIGGIATPQTAGIIAAVEGMGMLGVGTAASGLASLGVIIGGLTVIVEAFGALDKIPGIEKFTEGGGDLLATVMEQIGRAVGAVAEGFAVEISSGLPEIGANLAGFAENVKPFFDMAANADFSGMEGFASGLMALVGADIVNKLESLFGSGLDFGAIGEQLSAFSEAMIGFFVSAQEAGDTSAGIKLMEAAGHITELVEATKNWEAGWGEADLEGLGNALAKYAAAIIPFFQKAGEIGDTSAGIKLMGVSGKIKSLLSAAKTKGQIGTKSMTDLANALVEYAKGMKKYFEETAGITDMKNGLSLAEQSGALNGLINAAKDYEAGTLVTLGNDLATFSSMFKSFSENMAGDNKLDVTPIINQVSKLTSGVSSKGESFSKAISSMGKGAKNALNGIKNTFSSSASSIAKAADFSGKVRSAMGKVNSALSSARGTISQNLKAISSAFSKTKFDFTQHIAVPHFSMSGEFNAKKKTTPTVNTKWYAKAMEQPYLFDTPTFFGAGERGDEILYGKNSLMKDIKDAVKSANGGNVVINLNYDASADANDMLRDLARGLNRYKMAGVI